MKTAMLKRAGHSRMSVQLIRQRMHARSEKRIGRGDRVAVRQQIDLWRKEKSIRVAVRQQIDLWRKEKSIITPYPK